MPRRHVGPPPPNCSPVPKSVPWKFRLSDDRCQISRHPETVGSSTRYDQEIHTKDNKSCGFTGLKFNRSFSAQSLEIKVWAVRWTDRGRRMTFLVALLFFQMSKAASVEVRERESPRRCESAKWINRKWHTRRHDDRCRQAMRLYAR